MIEFSQENGVLFNCGRYLGFKKKIYVDLCFKIEREQAFTFKYQLQSEISD